MAARLPTLTSLFALAMFAPAAAVGDEKKENARDPKVAFTKLDADKDGKLTKDEFKKLAELFEGAVKKKPTATMVDKAFASLDADKDDALTLDEFKKVVDVARKSKKRKKGN